MKIVEVQMVHVWITCYDTYMNHATFMNRNGITVGQTPVLWATRALSFPKGGTVYELLVSDGLHSRCRVKRGASARRSKPTGLRGALWTAVCASRAWMLCSCFRWFPFASQFHKVEYVDSRKGFPGCGLPRQCLFRKPGVTPGESQRNNSQHPETDQNQRSLKKTRLSVGFITKCSKKKFWEENHTLHAVSLLTNSRTNLFHLILEFNRHPTENIIYI